jgi:LRR receptor-like serine/threonine-protein kinase FLS2
LLAVLCSLHTAAQPSAVDPQLDSLLKVKAAIDTTGVLDEWSSATGAAGGYCKWRGVGCIGNTYVMGINIWSGRGVQGLQGTLPPAAAFSGLPNLTVLNIGEQPGIKGTLPADWSRMIQLEDVRLTQNSLTGSIPASWGGMEKLQILNLTANGLSGRIPDSFRGLATLQLLILNDNGLTGKNACV